MTPQNRIEAYCRRYGVPATFASRLLPLVEKAQHAAPEVRERILELVEASFEKEAERLAWRSSRARASPDERVLRTIAAALHSWIPPKLGGADPEGPGRSDFPPSAPD